MRRPDLRAAKKAKPAAFFTPENASLVTIGNFEDDLAKLKDCDLIIEAVVENLEIKRSLYEKVEQHRRPVRSSVPTPAAFRSDSWPKAAQKISKHTFSAFTFSIHRATCISSK